MGQTAADRQRIANALGVSHPYALAPFAIMATEQGRCLAAALNPPPLLDAAALLQWDANPDSHVIAIDLQSGAVTLLGEPGSWLCGDPVPRQTMRLFTSGRVFAGAWAYNRQAHLERARASRVPGFKLADPIDHGLPGYVLAGELAQVTSWSRLLHCERVLLDRGELVGPVGDALIRAAGIPGVEFAGKPIAIHR